MQTSRFSLGVLCVLAAIVGAFVHLAWYYFAVLFAGGCGLMGQKSIWEKMATVIAAWLLRRCSTVAKSGLRFDCLPQRLRQRWD